MMKSNTAKILIVSLVLAVLATPVLTSCRHRDRGNSDAEETEKTQSDKVLRTSFYLERSGSMVAYDAEQGDGSFKAAVVDMMNHLPEFKNRKSNIFIVNNGVYPYPKGANQFIADNNIFASTKNIGDPSYTDFRKIFQTLANQTKGDNLNILVSDLIYSVNTNTENNPQKIFNAAGGMVASVFKDADDLALIVVQLKGSFNGLYYPFNTPEDGQRYDGNRPYYVVVMTTNEGLSTMISNPHYADFLDFSRLGGYQHIALFTKGNGLKPYYSFLLHGKENEGRYKAIRGQRSRITGIDDAEGDRNSGRLVMTLAVNLNGMPVEKSYLTDINNYVVSSDCGLRLKAIRRITDADRTPYNRGHLGSATHIFVLEADHVGGKNECVISLKKKLPEWIVKSNSDDDTNLASPGFSTTTFGLKYLLGGVWESFNSDNYFEMKLEIND